MTNRVVPSRRRNPAEGLVRVGAPVSGGRTWRDLAALANHVLGRGAHLVPAHCPTTSPLAEGTTHTFRYRVKPRFQCAQRRYYVRVRADLPSNALDCEVTINGGTTYARRAANNLDEVRTFEFVEDLSSASASEEEITIAVETDGVYGAEGSGGDIFVDLVSVVEMPRPALATGTADDGSDLSVILPGQPIIQDDVQNLMDALRDEALIGSRMHYAWSTVDSTTYAYSTTTTLFSTGEALADSVPVLGRKIGRSATTQTIEGRLWAWVTGTAEAEVRMTSSVNGAASAVAFTNTSGAWVSIPGLTIDCEDLGEDDGLQSSTVDEITVQVRKTTGTGIIYVSSVSLGEF